ncbi:monovalent cation:proton antiporter-2 (CPA2) family protein [Zavarzinia compransoris]|uniref:Potassium transporter n=1 Tax=Zavarzinia compransoris TaxID=1264899 RepID=A0A317EAC1_9PROT|nr:monovalent cation:proton antiporter-2 (CPA2) family protein [Zavarzinia compransoris]PWR23899.1 potassium transporter [Zavarzinia compransoris]TDP48143.1 Kef-type potassium/proton antiporter (CPA2 family) [Zavarzinia compransoris]
MAVEGAGSNLAPIVVLLGAGVVAVPLFRRLGLGSVLGYFTAGLAIGPFGFAFFSDPAAILHVAELGVVLFLFIVGLEMRPAKLWGLRREIFGLGVAQVVACGALLTGVGVLLGYAPVVAFIGGAGFVLSSTAVVMQVLNERGETATPAGQQAVSILLLEDLAIVPLLAVVSLLAPAGDAAAGDERWLGVVVALGALAVLVAAGRWLLNPLFAVLAGARAREVMTAAALLVVLGSALLMEKSGLSMALGAFLAGVLLSGSSFRHQLEVDIEPFKGLLLGLFFLAVGMSLDVGVVLAEWRVTLALVAAFMAAKGLGIYIVARVFGASNRTAITRLSQFAQGGEFAFVLYAAALAAGLMGARDGAVMSAAIILSMALTPILILAVDRANRAPQDAGDDLDRAEDLHGKVLMIGFGRFGQVASQVLLARGIEVSLIDNDPNRIREAGRFGVKVYYGDGTRLDVLHASGAGEAAAILVCIDDRAAATHIVDIVRAEFPLAKLLVRSYDRRHSIQLIRKGVDFEVRETFESALAFGSAALKSLGEEGEDCAQLKAEIRRRDAERLAQQVLEDGQIGSGRAAGPVPEPLTRPRKGA